MMSADRISKVAFLVITILIGCRNNDENIPSFVEPLLTANDTVFLEIHLNIPNEKIIFRSQAEVGHYSTSKYSITVGRGGITTNGLRRLYPKIELTNPEIDQRIEIGADISFDPALSGFDAFSGIPCPVMESVSRDFNKVGNQILCEEFFGIQACSTETANTPFYYLKYFHENSLERYYSSIGLQPNDSFFRIDNVTEIEFDNKIGEDDLINSILVMIEGEFKMNLYLYESQTDTPLDTINTDVSQFSIAMWAYQYSGCEI